MNTTPYADGRPRTRSEVGRRRWRTCSTPPVCAPVGVRCRPTPSLRLPARAGTWNRARVYELGGYPERSLNGFTKPVSGVMRELTAEGLLPADAAYP